MGLIADEDHITPRHTHYSVPLESLLDNRYCMTRLTTANSSPDMSERTGLGIWYQSTQKVLRDGLGIQNNIQCNSDNVHKREASNLHSAKRDFD